jgi:uncharacterized PurR-regulated membrane protein YhhQ (DUF165 family)
MAGAGQPGGGIGFFAFLLLVVLSSAVAELHGRAVANRLVRFGFVPLIVSMILLVTVINRAPAPLAIGCMPAAGPGRADAARA